MKLAITVLGSPAPQGSKKFVGTTASGRGLMVESSKKVKPWRQDVKAAAQAYMAGRAPLDGPLIALMTFTLPKPASAPKTRRTWPCRKPDASKLARSTEDALTDAGVWTDDARVVLLLTHKVYPLEGPDALQAPGVVIRIQSAMDAFCFELPGAVWQRPLLPDSVHDGRVADPDAQSETACTLVGPSGSPRHAGNSTPDRALVAAPGQSDQGSWRS